jgi:hypothetical protein
MDICRKDEPKLEAMPTGRQVRCWNMLG